MIETKGRRPTFPTRRLAVTRGVRRQFAVIVSFARVDGSRMHDWSSFHDEP